MVSDYYYAPITFFLATFIFTWAPLFYVAYLSFQKNQNDRMIPWLFFSITIPFLVAITLLFSSGNAALMHDFFSRLLLIKMDRYSLAMLIFIIPVTFFLATSLSLLFGQSKEQFKFAVKIRDFNKREYFSLLIPIVLAPVLEELGWRGYGVDSLIATTLNPLIATLLFGLLWSLWHLPLFFIKGYYQYELRNHGALYIANFFVSVVPLAIIFNWLYFKNHRSIAIIILAHALCNALSILFKTEQLTKVIFTILLSIVAMLTVAIDCTLFL